MNAEALLHPVDALARHAAVAPDHVACRGLDGRQWTRAELLRAIEATAAGLAALGLAEGTPVGLLVSDGMDWTVHMLALERAGLLAVALPDFFSDDQLRAVVADAGVRVLVADAEGDGRLGALMDQVVRAEMIDAVGVPALLRPTGPVRQLVYSSGTSGAPKGVLHDVRHLDAKAMALAAVAEADEADHVLSVLPMALLLEQIVAVRAALHVGACVTFAQSILRLGPQGLPQGLVLAAETAKPTVGVATPELLKAWIAGLMLQGGAAPASLRFLAVGGAPVAPALGERAWQLGLPVHEGYGLTETCSVATVNRPGRRVAGSVGHPLPGVRIVVENGELVVESDQLMLGYRTAADAPLHRWHTGDVGHIAADGSVVVLGRRDSTLVLPSGRNVSPEWVESHLTADPRIRHACVLPSGGATPQAVIEALPSLPGDEAVALAGHLVARLPAYARPAPIRAVEPGGFQALGLLTANGRLRRRDAARVWGG